MRRITIGIVAVVGLSADSAAQQSSPDLQVRSARQAAALVRAEYFRQNFWGGYELGRELIARFPRDPELRAWATVNKARSFWDGEAQLSADSIRASHPKSVWADFAGAFALAWTDAENPDALSMARRVRARAPKSPDALWLYGFVLHRAGRFADVVAFVDSALHVHEPFAELFVLKGNALASLRATDSTARERGLAAFAEARALDSMNVNAWFLPGANLHAPGDSVGIGMIVRAAQLSPQAASIRVTLWSRWNRLEMPREERQALIEADVARALDGVRPSPDMLIAAANAFGEMGRRDRQHALQERVLGEFRGGPHAERVLIGRIATLSDSLGRREIEDTIAARYRLREQAEAFLSRPRRNKALLGTAHLIYWGAFVHNDSTIAPDSLLKIARAFVTYERLNTSWTHYRVPLKLAEQHSDFAFARELVLTGDSIREAGIEQNRSRFQTDGDFAEAMDRVKAETHDALGWIALHEGNLEEATEELEKARELGPSNPLIHYHLGRLAEARGEPRGALSHYARGSTMESSFTGRENTRALERVYAVSHGSLEGFAEYVEQLQHEDRERRRRKIAESRLTSGDTIPDFTLRLHGRDGAITRGDLAGKTAVINFWGVWCGPCVREMPQIVRFHEATRGDSSVIFVTVNYNDPPETLALYAARHNLEFVIGLDSGGWVSDVAKVAVFPTTWFIDSRGQVVFRHIGASDSVFEEFMWRLEMMQGMEP